jgi:DNA-binding response OmpR family regulator
MTQIRNRKTRIQKLIDHMEAIEPQQQTRRVLIVDDDANVCKLVSMALADSKIESESAATVDQACSLLNNGKFGLVVLDWQLDRSGEEVLRCARQIDPLFPVIVMSGLPPEVITDALFARADSFVAKPFSAALLRAHILWWFERIEATPIRLLPARVSDIKPCDEIRNIYIRHVVKLLGDNVSSASEKLGIHRQTVSGVLKNED